MSNQTVVLLHSSASSARQWQPTIQALPLHFDVRTVEFHGHGAQAAWSGSAAMTLADEAALVESLLVEVGGAHLVGHSYGGAVALKVATRRPDLVRSLAVYEPVLFALLRDEPSSRREIDSVIAVAEAMRQHLSHGRPQAAAQCFIDFWSGAGTWPALSADRQAAFGARIAPVVRQFDALFSDELAIRDLARLRMPLLLLSGARTVPVARRVVHLLAAAQPAAQCEMLDGMGHMGPVTHPQAFNRCLIEFLMPGRGCQAARSVLTSMNRQPPETGMPRFLVERSFPDGLNIPMTPVGARVVRGVVDANAEHGVTWVHSYVSPDRKQTYCIYDGPSADAIRVAAKHNSLPVDRITEVSVLDPYFYQP